MTSVAYVADGDFLVTVRTAPAPAMLATNLLDLRRIPFFNGLPDDILDTISSKLRRERYGKDEIVYKQGGLGNALYLIESGQIAVVAEAPAGEKVLSYLGPGSYFGEMALLLGERRSATARVTIDANLLALYKADLDDLLVQHPTISLMFSRELSRRLSFTEHRPVVVKQYNIVAVIGGQAEALADSLARQTGGRVYLVKLDVPSPRSNGSGYARSPLVRVQEVAPGLKSNGLSEIVSAHVDSHDWILMHLAPRATEATMKAMELADICIQMGPATPQWKQILASRKHWLAGDNPEDVDPLARRIARKSLGLALSSGNARGIAHIGVLKVLEEAKIPIDVMAGTSAGALFGSLYAAGMTITELTVFARELHRKSRLTAGLWDFALPPRSGLIKGNRTVAYLKQFLGNKRFEDLKLPMHVVAADILSGEQVVFSDGPMAEAVRASISVIGLFAPAKVGSRYLIDGGTVNPVPTSVLAERGADIILASTVIPSLEDRLTRKAMQREGKVPNLMGVLMSTMEVMESEIVRTRMNPADVVIRPQVEGYSGMDFERVDEFISLGEDAAYGALDQIKQLFQTKSHERLN